MTTTPLVLEIGKRLSPSEAKAFTDEIKHRMYARWNERIFGGPFMRNLEAGKLPMETIRLFLSLATTRAAFCSGLGGCYEKCR